MTSHRTAITIAVVSALVLVAAVLAGTGVLRIGADYGAAITEAVVAEYYDGELPPVPQSTPTQLDPATCSVLERIPDAMSLLADVTLDVGDTDIEYWEVRNGKERIFNDPEKEFALVVLRRATCELELVTITKRGDELIAPSPWRIEPVRRASGIRWNNWNTHFNVTYPEDAVVIANVEPFVTAERPGQRITASNGAIRTVYTTSRAIEYRPYVPYSLGLHVEEMVTSGREYLPDLVARTFADLREHGVRSRAFPERTVAELPFLTQAMFVRLPIIEHMDMLEFVLAPDRTIERVFVILAGNGERAFGFTCSSASACGLMQFTDARGDGTYSLIRDRYPEAELTFSFEEGARDHLNVMKAAVLLHDNNLRLLVNVFGEAIVQDPRLEEFLAALYNASPASVVPAIREAFRRSSDDWTRFLPDHIQEETGGYIVKLRYLVDGREQLAASTLTHPAE